MKASNLPAVVKNSKAMTAITRAAGKVKLAAVKHSPELLVAAGGVLVVAGFVTGCIATTHAHEVIEKYENTRQEINEAKRLVDDGLVADAEYTDQDYKKDKVLNIVQTTGRFIALYALPVGLMTSGIACFLASYGILHKRNAALMAAYNALDASFKRYRERVREQYGAEADTKCMYGADTVEKETVQTEHGPVTVTTVDGQQFTPSKYARFFDESNENWTKSAEANLDTLIVRQNWANDKLRQQGHLFLNEVYDILSMPRTQIGNIVGWMLGPDGKDGYVDFGIYNIQNPSARDFVNGYERSVLIDFNVDGVILNKLEGSEQRALGAMA